ncbi:MAG: SGNH/GDSL hydrolase family protein [Anaerolineae bacterium]
MNPTSPSLRYLALGDSYTIGERVAPQDRWPVQLARLLVAEGIDVQAPEIIARTGWTTDELAAAIDQAQPQGPYALVSLLIGVNNQYRGCDVAEYRQQAGDLLHRAIALAGDQPAHVLALSIPDWGQTPFARGQDRARIGAAIDRFNAVQRAECERLGIAFVDITPGSRQAGNDPTLIASDGLHPSGKMYAEWARLALPVARAALTRA